MMISIITINLNQSAGLERTLASIRNQHCQPHELIVIDGGSTDGFNEVIEPYMGLITFWVSEPDKGIYHAMNKGWKKATGDYCLFLNAGDHLHGERALEHANAALEKHQPGILYGNLLGHKDGDTELNDFTEPVSLYYFYKWYLPHPASFIRTSLLHALGGYYEQYRVISDWAFMIRALLANARYKHLPFTISEFYADGLSSTGNLGAVEKKQIMDREFAFLKNDFEIFKKFRYMENSRFMKAANNFRAFVRKAIRW